METRFFSIVVILVLFSVFCFNSRSENIKNNHLTNEIITYKEECTPEENSESNDFNANPDVLIEETLTFTSKESKISEIGSKQGFEADNPNDNTIVINVNHQIDKTDKVYLEYDLYGLVDKHSVCKSINNHLAFGGIVMQTNHEWTHQTEQLPQSQIKTGVNTIRFSLPEDINISYKIKNVNLKINPQKEIDKHLVFNKIQVKKYTGDFIYIIGVVNQLEETTNIYANNQVLKYHNGIFEGVIKDNNKTSEIEIKAQLKSGDYKIQTLYSENAENYDYIMLNQNTLDVKKEIINPLNEFNLSMKGISLIAGAGSVLTDKEISVTGLRYMDMPLLDFSMINVTSDHSGYRCLPHGTLFENDIDIVLKYDETKLPKGYSPEDIRTFYYNDTTLKWEMLEYVNLNTTEHTITSKTNHFTDFINAIIKTPELPQTQAFTPTSMKDQAYAHPLSGFNIMGQPAPNNQGSAQTSFPLQIPQGRKGMQPSLAINYNSDGGNAWLGVGWNLSIPAISVDNTWGVPKFSQKKETESYLVAGEQIVELNNGDIANRFILPQFDNAYRPRGESSETFYAYRVEGKFNKIIRHGNKTNNYWWEVIDKSGTKYFYGRYSTDTDVNNSLILSDNAGNISHWALAEIRDIYGNYVKYKYEKTNTTTGGISAQQIYIKNIKYTGFGNTDGKYQIAFKLKAKPDSTTSARNGFLESNSKLLESIDISFNDEFIRRYELRYVQGAYGKSLLKAIIDITDEDLINQNIDYNNVVQNFGATVHTFDYFEEQNIAFEEQSINVLNTWETGDIVLGINEETLQSLGRNRTFAYNIGGTLSFGLGSNVASKVNSIGGNITTSGSSSMQKTQLMDINGDGLLDKLVKDMDGVKYFKGLILESGNFSFDNSSVPILSLPKLTQSFSLSESFGGEVLAGVPGVNASVNYKYGIDYNITSNYFSDVNGDGLVDYFDGSRVLFNALDENETPAFYTLESLQEMENDEDNCYSFNYEGEVSPFENTTDEGEAQIEKVRRDPVVMFRANKTGWYKIKYNLNRTKNNPQLNTDVQCVFQTFQQSGRCSVLKKNQESLDLYTNKQVLERGDQIYFRFSSNEKNGFDESALDFEISGPLPTNQETLPETKDANDEDIYHYKYGENTVLSDGQIFSAPFSGTVNIHTDFSFIEQSDDVTFSIIHKVYNETTETYQEQTILSENYPNATPQNQNFDFSGIEVNANDKITFEFYSESNIHWSDIDFNASIDYENYTINETSYSDSLPVYHPVPQMNLYPDIVQHSSPVLLTPGTSYTISPDLNLDNFSGQITLTAKSKRKKLGSVQLSYDSNGELESLNNNSFLITVPDNDSTVFFDYFCDSTNFCNPTDSCDTTDTYNLLYSSKVSITGVGFADAGFFAKFPQSDWIFGNLYRGWGQFSYTSEDAIPCRYVIKDSLYVQTNETDLDSAFMDENFGDINENSSFEDVVGAFDASGLNVNTNPTFATMKVDKENNQWVDFCNSAYLREDTIGSGLAEKQLFDAISTELAENNNGDFIVPNPNQLFPSNSLAPYKHSKQISHSFSFGGGAGPVNFSKTFSWFEAKTKLDFMDLNGDRFPDIVHSNKIQYTTSQGSIGNVVYLPNDRPVNGSSGGTDGVANGVKGFSRNGKNADFVSTGKITNIDGSFGIGDSNGDSEVDFTYFDINGDGLPDYVQKDSISLNLGYTFLPKQPISPMIISQSDSRSFNLNPPGLYFNFDEYSISAGLGLSKNNSYNKTGMLDFNNDGLVDYYLYYNDNLLVFINRGNNTFAISNSIIPIPADNYDKQEQTKNIAINGSLTVGAPIFFAKILYTYYADASYALSSSKYQYSDINGDGFVDFLYIDDNIIKARLGIPQKSNLLKRINTPAKSTYNFTYERTVPCVDNPNSKWVMATLQVFDGFVGDGSDTLSYRFLYKDPMYHRKERASLGFETVITQQYNNFTDNNLYRQTTEKYHTDCFLFKDLKYYEGLSDADNKKYTETLYEWAYKDIVTGNIISQEDAECFGGYYPALSQEDVYFYEGESTAKIHTKKQYNHGAYGNVCTYINHGNIDTENDDLIASVNYLNDTVQNHYFIGLPTRIKVLSADETLLQLREASYGNKGELLEIRNFINGGNSAKTNLTYDTYGNVSNITFPKNINNKSLRYDYKYDNIVHTYPIAVKDYWGNVSATKYDYKLGLPLKTADITNNKMYFTYYPNGKPKTIVGPNEISSQEFTIKFEYWETVDAQHPYFWAKTRHYDPLANGNEFITSTICDGLGRTVQTKKKETVMGNDKTILSGKVRYDDFGRARSVSLPKMVNLGNWTNYTENDINKLEINFYDVLDRPVAHNNFDGTSIAYHYGFGNDVFGNTCFVTKLTDENHNQVSTFTNAMGQKTQTTAPENTITSFRYNPLGQLLTAYDPEGNKTVYKYDILGRMIKREHPDAGRTEYVYDLAGNILELRTENLIASGSSIKYRYNNCRLVQIHYLQNPEMDVFYNYGAPQSGNQSGRLIAKQDASGIEEYKYGNMGELIKSSHTYIVPGGETYTFTTQWRYDTWNRLVGMTYPDGEKIRYYYNTSGKLHAMRGHKGSNTYFYIDNIHYNQYGKRAYIKYGNNTSVRYYYHYLNQRLETLISLEATDKCMQRLDYKYDNVGNILSVRNDGDFVSSESSGGLVFSANLGGKYEYNYHYDNLYRLTSANADFNSSEGLRDFKMNMSYSPSGNILNKIQAVWTLGVQADLSCNNTYIYSTSKPHAPEKIGNTDYKWDKNGNQIFRENTNNARFLSWDEENRLNAVHDYGNINQVSAYMYDSNGDRTWKLSGVETQMQINGQTTYNNANLSKTLYAGPYMVITEQEYSKHYYIEGERVCTKIGSGFGTAQSSPVGQPLECLHSDVQTVSHALNHMLEKNLGEVSYNGSVSMSPTLSPAENNNSGFENLQYFYHSDHLGSSSFVTNRFGRAVQHLQYLPFGEVFINQRSTYFNSPYKFTAKEHDPETNYTYFGARYYDSDLSIFLSVDRFADKYLSLTPYHYCANNPIIFTDPTGDTVKISHKGNDYIYDGGKLYLNEAEYTGKVKGFLKQVANALGTIEKSAEGASMLEELSSSSNIFTIKRGSSEFKSSSIQKAYANQLTTDPALTKTYVALTKAGVDLTGGSGGTIYWNPSGSALPTTLGIRTSAFSDLAHEMFHGLDANRGLLDDRTYLHPKVNRSEWQAVYRENMMRSQLNMPLRTHYITKQNPSGTILGGAGPNMLTPANNVILPFWYTK